MFVKSKTQPPELIFVVLNFMALDLDNCTRHTPFSIEQKPNSAVTITKLTETEIFPVQSDIR